MKKDYAKTYYKTELCRIRNKSHERFPDFLVRNIVLSDEIHNYIYRRMKYGQKVDLDIAAFEGDDGESLTIVLGVPFNPSAPKNKSLKRMDIEINNEEEEEIW